jgi:hypothetical protein
VAAGAFGFLILIQVSTDPSDNINPTTPSVSFAGMPVRVRGVVFEQVVRPHRDRYLLAVDIDNRQSIFSVTGTLLKLTTH